MVPSASFPHLRELHEKYASRGLVIVGVTQYCQQEWDDKAQCTKRAQSPKEVTAEREQATLMKFARHHQLKYRIAVTHNSNFKRAYGVTAIPQFVLIDRSGIVRLIRVGSGPPNEHDLDEKLTELFREPAAVRPAARRPPATSNDSSQQNSPTACYVGSAVRTQSL